MPPPHVPAGSRQSNNRRPQPSVATLVKHNAAKSQVEKFFDDKNVTDRETFVWNGHFCSIVYRTVKTYLISAFCRCILPSGNIMRIGTPEQLGVEIQRQRKRLRITQKDLAMACGTGLRFIVDLEKGKPTCQIGKALQVLQSLGLTVRTMPLVRTDTRRGGDAVDGVSTRDRNGGGDEENGTPTVDSKGPTQSDGPEGGTP